MKTLLLVRHAKSAWDQPGLLDKDRPLGARGKRDAPIMASVLRSENLQPDKLVSSTARRANDTAVAFAKELGMDHWDIKLVDECYEAMPDTLQAIVARLDSQWETVCLFGHNPGFTIYANRFGDGFRFDNVPTCGIVRIEAPVEAWSDFLPGTAKITKWYFPKDYAHQ